MPDPQSKILRLYLLWGALAALDALVGGYGIAHHLAVAWDFTYLSFAIAALLLLGWV